MNCKCHWPKQVEDLDERLKWVIREAFDCEVKSFFNPKSVRERQRVLADKIRETDQKHQ